ncbi:MAG: hypothetical protein OHK0029_10820 [Armatimonadaceae bacterium]
MNGRLTTFAASVLLTAFALPGYAQSLGLTPESLQTALRSAPSPNLAEQIRSWFGAKNLAAGANPKVAELTVAWAIEVPGLSPGEEPRVVNSEKNWSLPLKRIGQSDIYAGTATLPEGEAFLWAYEVKGERKGDWRQVEVYTTPPELKKNDAVPAGKQIEMPVWRSQIFENTERQWWVYVPAQYDPAKPACVMVFQDGGGVRNQISTLFDNMIAKGEMPVTIGIFINPGRRPDQEPGARPANRSREYDTLSDRYARFLIEEILPEVGKQYNLRQDAAGRAIAGTSSGGICAFTVAWERPDAFKHVVSGVGSFVNLQGGESGIGGGHNYPTLIRKTRGMPKPIRVFLTDGSNDLDNQFGHWPLNNLRMEKALAFSGYDYKFLYGKGFHNNKYYMVTMPQALRWIWRDEVTAK